MAKLIIENLSLEQAKELANWYEGQGEQDAYEWFQVNDIPCPHVDVHRKQWMQVDKTGEGTVTIYAA